MAWFTLTARRSSTASSVIEPYLTLLAPAWQQAKARQLTLVCSEIVLAATQQHWERCARLRAETGLKSADALHAATALRAGCDLFTTNDADFRRVEGLPVVVLSDLVSADATV